MDGSIKIGSIVHLKNKALGYLDSCGYVRDEPHFSGHEGAVALVRTSDEPNRDQGSGKWKIVSAGGKKADGEPLTNTDQVHLENVYGHVGYLGRLALFGEISNEDVSKLTALDRQYFGGGAYVFTCTSKESRYEEAVGPASFAFPLVDNPPDHGVVPIQGGAEVKVRCYVKGDDGSGVRSGNHFLQAFGPNQELGMLERPIGTGMVFASPNEAMDTDSAGHQIWEITLSE